ncbi:MAG: DUF1257 domain-containing protein [Candidatus Sericytochromatia bacterium]|nr:DUF1257 domain-containing protein [Candidatus Sericytochromatia bacterium]
MSHFTRVKTRIMDLECLELALSELDYRVIHEARIRGWQNQHKPAQLVAQFPGQLCAYDIGFVFNPKQQTFDMVADWWAIKERIGHDQDALSEQIMQRYAYQKVVKEVKARGFMISEQKQDADQSIRLVVRKW